MSEKSRESEAEIKTSYLDSLFESFNIKGIKITDLSRSWHALYNTDKFHSFNTIFGLLTKSCGIDIRGKDLKKLIKKPRELLLLLEKEGKKVQNFPLQSLIKSKKIRDFLDFFKNLVILSEDCPESLSEVLKLTIELSSSTLRNLRQTCIWVTSGLVEGYCKLIKLYLRKLQSQKSSSRPSFQKEQQRTQDRLEFIQNILSELISTVLLVRSKDVYSDIRVHVVQVLSKLLTSSFSLDLSEHLFELSKDPKNEVRLEVLKTLENLKSEEVVRYKSRILEMCFDKDDKCCALAIKLCKDPAFNLDANEKNRLQDLLWAQNKEIQKAANDFVIFHVFKNSLPQTVGETIGGFDQNKSLTIENALIALAEYFRENSPSFVVADQFVELMWHKTSAIRSCDSMCELLSRGSGKHSGSGQLEESLKLVLCSFLESALKFLQKDAKLKIKLINFSGILFKKMPDLLTFYSEDLNILRQLVKIIPLLDLHALASNDLKFSFVELLGKVSTIFTKFDDFEVLKSCGNAIEKFSSESHPLKKEGQAEMISVLNLISPGNFKNFLPQLSAMMRFKDLTEYVDVKLVKHLDDPEVLSSEATCNLMFYWQFWLLKKFFDDPSKEHEYLLIRNKSFETFTSVMEKEAYYPSSREALIYLCETLYHIADDSPISHKLNFKIEDFLWQAIEKYMIYMYLPNYPEEDSNDAEKVCMFVGRIIEKCPEIMNSHLCSSFLAFFGRSKLIRISTIVKQVLQRVKRLDFLATGLFSDRKLFYSISFQTVLKVVCKGEAQNIEDMKETCRKLVMFLPNEKSENCQGRFKSFLNEIIEFTFTDPSNLPILECLTVFVTKATMEMKDIEEIYEHVKYYKKALSRTREHVETVLNYLKKILKKNEDNDEGLENSDYEEFAVPKTDGKEKKTDGKERKTDGKERKTEKDTKTPSRHSSNRKRTRQSLKKSENPRKMSTRKSARKKKIA